MSIIDCLNNLGDQIDPDDRAEILALQKERIDAGENPDEAAFKAAGTVMAKAQKNRKALAHTIRQKGGKPPRRKRGEEPVEELAAQPQQPGPGGTFSKAAVEAHLQPVTARFAKSVRDKIHVVDSFKDIPPEDRQTANPAASGVYSGVRQGKTGGRIYVIADKVTDLHDAEVTLAHEAIGHKGVIEGSTAPEWDAISRSIKDLLQVKDETAVDIMQEVDRRYAGEPQYVKDAEFLAIATERRVKRGATAKVVGKFKEMARGALKKMGFKAAFNDAELDIILSRSEQFLHDPDKLTIDLKDKGFSEEEINTWRKMGAGRQHTHNTASVDTTLGTRMQQYVFDQFRSFDKILESPRAHMMAHLTKATTGALETVINSGQVYMEDGALAVNTNEKSLKQALEPLGQDLDKWLGWMAGNRAEKLMSEGKENLLNGHDIQVLKGMNKGKEDLFDSVRKDFEEVHGSVMDVAVETGLVNEAQAKEWEQEGFYLPFYRVLETETGSEGPRMLANSGLVRQQAFKELKGGKEQLGDLLNNVLMNWNHLLDASMKNQAATEALKAAEKMGLATKISGRQDSNSVFVRKDGVEQWYQIDNSNRGNLVLDSLTSLNWQSSNAWHRRTARAFKRALTFGVTINPEFKIANLLRDSIQAIAVGKHMSGHMFQNWITGTKALKDEKTHADMLAGGAIFGESGYIHGADPEMIRRLVEKGVPNQSILTTKKQVTEAIKNSAIGKAFEKYQDAGSWTENVNRAAQYQNTLKKEGRLRANFDARDHLDFTRMGSAVLIRDLAEVVPFLNARLQGLHKLGRAARDPEQKIQFAATVATYAVIGTALAALMQDDEDYKAAEEWERRAYHLFKLPGYDNVMFRFPRPFEIGAISYAAESAMELFTDEIHMPLFAERLYHTLSDTFALNPTPQVFKPALEVAMNKNWFTGRDIESMSMRGLSPEKRKNAWTSEGAILTSEIMDNATWGNVVLSPVAIQHMVRGYLGWLGATTLDGIDMVVRASTDAPPEPESKPLDKPILKRFARDADGVSTKYTTLYYERSQEMAQAVREINAARRSGNLEEYEAAYEEHADKLQYKDLYDSAAKHMKRIKQELDEVMRDPDMPPEEKRIYVDDLTREKNELTKLVYENTGRELD